MMYFPRIGTPAELETIAAKNHLTRWTNAAGVSIGWKRLSTALPVLGEVLISHGNGDCAANRNYYVDALQQAAALDVFILEYPGFGDRPGKPSESSLFSAAENAFDSLPRQKPIYLLGESLGTGVACYLAGARTNQAAGVLLVAPYNNLDDAAQAHLACVPASLFVRDHFKSDLHLSRYRGPVAVLCGGKDTVIPAALSRRLYDGYAGPKRLWQVPDADHGTIPLQPTVFWREMVEFWQTTPQP